jgi:hypothetical protein
MYTLGHKEENGKNYNWNLDYMIITIIFLIKYCCIIFPPREMRNVNFKKLIRIFYFKYLSVAIPKSLSTTNVDFKKKKNIL